jgi:predicted solute-binding protein
MKQFFFALFACKRNTPKRENNGSETKRTKRKIAIPVNFEGHLQVFKLF